jgi:UDP-N-acetylmuramoyl-L-alanyl-D-glutamate--2,6-diaminopimelate ligase
MKYQLTIKQISNLFDNEIENESVITGISYNSKEIKEGDVFVCLVGEKTDGHNFIKEAESKGAKAIIVSREIESSLPIIKVKDTQIAIAKLSNLFYGEPSKKLRVIGITGTNGKTTTTHLIQHILEKSSLKTAVIGTLGTRESTDSSYYDAKHTTPQAPELQKQIASLVEKGFKNIAMEVSSHALSQHRVEDTNFAGAVLTNLTQDHLDFHLTMESYFQAKRKLFEMINDSSWKNKYAIINKDDAKFNGFSEAINSKKVKLYSYGIKNTSDFQAKDIVFNPSGLSFELISPAGKSKVTSKLNGLFNVYNLLAAIASTYAEGIELKTIIEHISSASQIPGRFQIIHSDKNTESPICIVDYAHTPDGLENILKAARLMVKENKKLFCVFGCGGDRDPTKRPKMGKIAEDLSDIAIVTSDNPRSEDPKQIISDILSGIKNTSDVIVEADRKAAIEIAIKKASKDDVVVIAGKGHEDYQILKDKTIHFDDREEVSKALNAVAGR